MGNSFRAGRKTPGGEAGLGVKGETQRAALVGSLCCCQRITVQETDAIYWRSFILANYLFLAFLCIAESITRLD
ncbi:MAG: hypothetical protein ACK56F_28995 [bacterium]